VKIEVLNMVRSLRDPRFMVLNKNLPFNFPGWQNIVINSEAQLSKPCCEFVAIILAFADANDLVYVT